MTVILAHSRANLNGPVSHSSHCTESMEDAILYSKMRRFGGWRIDAGSREYPLVIAHRGGAGLAPENTRAAFEKALELGADGVELDVRLTRDRRAAVLHDRRVDRTTTGSGLVGSLTLEELSSLDAGSWFGPGFAGERVPSLEQVFGELPHDFPIYVEMKARGLGAGLLVAEVVEIVRSYERWESTMVASSNPLALVSLRLMEPRITRGYIWSSRHPLPMRARWMSPLVKPYWFAPDRGSINPGLLARFHSRGNPVAAWDVDMGTGPPGLGNMGLDAVVTDYPDKFVEQKRNMMQGSSSG